MLFRTKQQEDFTVFILETPNLLNARDIEVIDEALATMLDGGTRRLMLDFGRVKHISSQALSMILRVHLLMEKHPGGEVILCGVSPQMLDAVKILRLDRLIPIFPTRRDALRARQKPKQQT
jgi:anti-sigma B factor antagonist